MKRVLLINPNTEQSPYPVAPIGLCLVAASLKQDFDVHLLDATFDGASRLSSCIAEISPDYIGISIRNIDDVTSIDGRFYIDDIKRDFIEPVRAATRAPIILGGAGFSLFPSILVHELHADFGVVGEGEDRFFALLSALEAKENPASIAGVIVPNTKETISTAVPRPSALLQIPFSTVDAFIDFNPYRVRGSYPIQTKRGCKLKCVYCSYPLIEGTEYRLRLPAQIVDEIEEASHRLGPVTFEFVDSTFNAPLYHAKAVCREIIRRKLNVRLRSMGMSPGRITDPLLHLMRRAGFTQIVCSADTAAGSTLKQYQKGFTRNKLEIVAKLIQKHDMPVMWSFIFGGPGETEDTIEESFDFISRFVQPLDMVHMTEGIRIYPDTPILSIAIREGIVQSSTPLLRPVFYVSPKLDKDRLSAVIAEKSAIFPNCIRASDSSVDPETMQQALALRKAENLTEPMFRTLLRIRREKLKPV